MLKAHVSLSRKITRDFNSSGYQLTLEGEIPVPPDQPDEVMKHVHRLFQLAEKALDQEIDRDQGEQSIGRRDEEPNGRYPSHPQPQSDRESHRPSTNGRPTTNGQQEEPATPKQTAYIENLRKRSGMTKAQLDTHIQEILGHRVPVDQLTKPEAGKVIESLANNQPANGRR